MNHSSITQDNFGRTEKQRCECLICNHRINSQDQSLFTTFPCNIRAFKDETFKVWSCPDCHTLHCLDVVDLNRYYTNYPYGVAKLSLPFRLYYLKRCQELAKYGIGKPHSILDYGCGVNGLVVQYLREQGYENAYGYDPYASEKGFGNRSVLQHAPFDCILLQDVIEHVEDPHVLLTELNNLLAPGGYILIGTPNASNIDLTRPNQPDYYNPVHVPCHLHIFTREVMEALGNRQGWEVVEYRNRAYHDTRWFGLNPRAASVYQRCCDGMVDVLFEPINLWKVLTSFEFIFNAIFGYWLSYRTEMTIIFRKSEKSASI